MKRSSLFLCLVPLLILIAAGIPVTSASPTISLITPDSTQNYSDVTVTILGTGFNKDSTVWMKTCDGTSTVYGTIVRSSATSITARFSFRNDKPNTYNVWVNSPFTDTYGNYFPKDAEYLPSGFRIYPGTGTTYTTTKPSTTTTGTATVTTTVTSGEGENSVFFETNPPGATIYLNGNEIGMSTFTYYTNKEGVYEVTARLSGYQDYEAKVAILEGKRVHFYAPLTELAPGETRSTTPRVSGTPSKAATPVQKSSLKIPTPLGTFIPVTEESPADPAIVLVAGCIAIGLVLLRRR